MRVVSRSLLGASLVGASLLLVAGCIDKTTGPKVPGTMTLASGTPSATAARGTSATFPIAIARGNGFTGDVTLSAESVPTGVTATFAPASLGSSATSSVLTLDVGASATAGTYSVSIRARGANVTDQVVQVSLSIPAPAITLVAGSQQVSMVQGTAVTVPVNVTRINGFTGPIDLTITGLPGGLSAAFAPASIPAASTTSTLTLTALNNATVGTLNLTVSANGAGVTQQNASFQLTIAPGEQPNFTVTATPAALSVTAGQSVQSTLALSRVGGFTDAVNFSVSGVPAGMTATVAPVSTTTNSAVLTLATASAITPGAYNLTVRGNSPSLPERIVVIGVAVAEAPGLAITIAPGTLTMPQSQSRQAVLAIARTGGLTGNVALTLEGAPNGVTAAFAPSPATGTASTLTVTTSVNTITGSYPLTVRGTGAGGVTTTAPLTLVVTPASFTLSAAPTSVSLPPGTSTTATISLARDPGFTGAVTFSMADVPVGVSVSFAPSTTTDNSVQLTVTSNFGTLINPYSTSIIGRSAGRADQVLPFTINIVPPVAGAGNIVWKFCDPARVPLVFAYRNGTTGVWTGSLPSQSGEIVATFSQPVGSIAVVYEEGVVTRTDVYSGTPAELQQIASLECVNRPGATKSYSAFVTGIAGLDQVSLAVGSATTAATVGQPIAQLTGVQAGSQYLFATRFETVTNGGVIRTPNRMLVRRGVDLPDGTVLSPVDMAGTESFVPASSTLTIENAGGQSVAASGLLIGSDGNAIPTYTETPGPSVIRQYFGLPTPTLQVAELQAIVAAASTTTGVRTVVSYYRSLSDRTITFGPELAAPSFTTSNSGGLTFPRARTSITEEYGASFGAQFVQNNIAVTLFATRSYVGAAASEFVLDVPDLTGVGGFLTTYALGQGLSTQIVVTGSGSTGPTSSAPANGAVVRSASRISTRRF